jgi:molybdate transport system substrate-binding protein
VRRAGLAFVVVLLAGCGSDGEPRLTVSAASSLKPALTAHAEEFDGAEVRLSFAGSDQLAAQIRAGARPDVFASADESIPAALHRDGLVERPLRFATNELVVAVRRDAEQRRFGDLARPGTKIAAGSRSVPVGRYAREALARHPEVAENIVSEEPDVSAVVGRVRSGAVDAGFVYASDVRATPELRAIALPVDLEIHYSAAVVRGGDHPAEARRFVRSLRGLDL